MANQKTFQGDGGNGATNDSHYRGDGASMRGTENDDQPDLFPPSGVDARDHGSTGEASVSERGGPTDPERGTGQKPA